MTSVRQRRGIKSTNVPQDCLSQEKNWKLNEKSVAGAKQWKKVSLVVGGIVGLFLGILTSVYISTLHENDLWFSNIKEVEREISFRTECGLHSLIYDNKTESMRTINILERMNVYQEVFLSMLYTVLHLKRFLEPVYFYIYTLFSLQAVCVLALYATSWLLSGTWLSGVLAAVWYIVNRVDTTRVEFTIPLRENWALPFFAIQLTAITVLFRPHLRSAHEFILLIQAMALFTLDCLDMIPEGKVVWLYIIQVASLLMVYTLQFFNSMIIGSLLVSFNMSALLARKLQNNLKTGGLLSRIGKLLLHVLLVLCLTFLVNNFIKRILNLESDEHIFKFLKAKFGFGATRDFDANLYLCEEAFGLLPFNTFARLSDTLVFYAYLFVLLITATTAAVVSFQNLSGRASIKSVEKQPTSTTVFKPAMAYHLMHTISFGLLAISTMRMKYLWTSHVCMFAASGLCSGDIWGLVSVIRYITPILILLYLCYKFLPGIMAELSELREFYDPDTVELMNWIKSHTPKKAVIAGSMQLLAGVKLCTGRILTNHPHYEDKSLRERTKQVYAKRSPEDVHRILRSFGTDFVILEDSICYERRHSRGCRLRDLLDIANGHEIKRNLPSYTMYFTKVFHNKTFHVYKLARHQNIT
ncbi:Protein dpy-19-like 3 [Ophiophagus hannah]|uniref:Protein dpy-19-like 3 n=1 Tax=Ophiophagus hannah TaxID=8665 RepID=V8N8C9_OPHHA|nr:Protein dpy-19-like 3 [Ophiophagus hannah]